MAENSGISWTDHTWNPWMGCVKVSAGCDNCYAERLTTGRMKLDVWGKDAPRKLTSEGYWRKPHAWERAAQKEGRRFRVFCGSLCDWAEAHPTADEARPRLWDTIRATPHLDWLLLTKRPGRIPRCLPPDWGVGWRNVWMGTSIESMDVAYRADHLRAVPARVRFISYEPALGPLDGIDLTDIHWLIYGGESGPSFRPEGTPDDPQKWARDARDLCERYGTVFFFKQSAARRNETNPTLDGVAYHAWPEAEDTELSRW